MEIGHQVGSDRPAEDPAIIGHGGTEQADGDVDDQLYITLHILRQENGQRIESNVTGIANANGGPDHGDIENEDDCEVFRPAGRVVQHVTAEDLVKNDGHKRQQTGNGQDHADLGKRCVDARQPASHRRWMSGFRFAVSVHIIPRAHPPEYLARSSECTMRGVLRFVVPGASYPACRLWRRKQLRSEAASFMVYLVAWIRLTRS
ncbi:hypothetical protein D3C87_1571490 [compost metagenome]